MTLPLLMLPGMGCDASIWEACPRGIVMQSDKASIQGMAEDILAAAPPRFALLGHSMGGYVALEMFAMAPTRIECLALISSSARADDAAQRSRREALIAAANSDYPRVAEKLCIASLSPRSLEDGLLRNRILSMLLRTGPEAFVRQSLAVMERRDYRELLADITVRTLVMCGEADSVINPAHSVELANCISDSELIQLPRCGHMPPAEWPNAVSAAIERWLRAPLPPHRK